MQTLNAVWFLYVLPDSQAEVQTKGDVETLSPWRPFGARLSAVVVIVVAAATAMVLWMTGSSQSIARYVEHDLCCLGALLFIRV